MRLRFERIGSPGLPELESGVGTCVVQAPVASPVHASVGRGVLTVRVPAQSAIGGRVQTLLLGLICDDNVNKYSIHV